MDRKTLEFVTYCIVKLSVLLKLPQQEIYRRLSSSGILYDYIVPSYDVLHTFSSRYLMEDLTSYMREKGVLEKEEWERVLTALGLEQLREQLAAFYAKQVDDEMDQLWESGQFDEKRLKELRGSHFRTPYNKQMMNPVVIDTNCLLQIISRKSPYRPIWDAFLAGRFDLCVSNEILEEYQQILTQQITQTVAENVVLLILNQKNVRLVDPHFRMGIITADPDDNKFVDCAFAAGADYLVSEDSHLNVLRTTPFPQLNLVTLDEFMQTRLII